MVLRRYLTVMFMRDFAMLLGGGLALTIGFDLLENTDNILSASDGDRSAVGRYVLLRLPDVSAQLIPIAALLAAIFTLGNLLKRREIVVMWGSGVSPLSLMRLLSPAGLLVGLMLFAINDWAVPAAAVDLRALNVGPYKTSKTNATGRRIWALSGDDVVRLTDLPDGAGAVGKMTIFRRDSEGRLVARIDATGAERRADHWILRDVVRRTVGVDRAEFLPLLRWDSTLEPHRIRLVARDPKELPIIEIDRLVETKAYGMRPVTTYETWRIYRIVSALAPLLMVAIAIALAQQYQRTGTFSRLLVAGVVGGFGFLFFDKVTLMMGEAGFLPPWLAAATPTVVVACLVIALLIRGEGARVGEA